MYQNDPLESAVHWYSFWVSKAYSLGFHVVAKTVIVQATCSYCFAWLLLVATASTIYSTRTGQQQFNIPMSHDPMINDPCWGPFLSMQRFRSLSTKCCFPLSSFDIITFKKKHGIAFLSIHSFTNIFTYRKKTMRVAFHLLLMLKVFMLDVWN